MWTTKPRFSAEYHATLASDHWRWVRGEALRRAGYRCERCGVGGPLDAHHHRGYRMLGHERPQDLRMLCRRCHRRAHFLKSCRRVLGRLAAWLAWLLIVWSVVWVVARWIWPTPVR